MHTCEKYNCVIIVALTVALVTHSIYLVDAKRSLSGSNRKPSSSSSGSNTRHTTPTHATNSDLTRLSYANNNAPINRPAQQPAPIGWNVPKQQGPPPAYSASNPSGGAHTNMHESPPAYRPPSYPSSNVHTPITATNTHGFQNSYPQQYLPASATYHSPGTLPAGATYYPSNGHYSSAGGVPAGATYLPAGASLPAGATYYAQPQSSSGLGFGSGLVGGLAGGALLGHLLTPTQTQVIQPAQGSVPAGGDNKVIIINNGPPDSVTTTDGASGTTIIHTGVGGVNTTTPEQPVYTIAPLAPMNPVSPVDATNNITTAAVSPVASSGPEQPVPPPGDIICVPVRVNETDPNESSKTIEVEKVACYPAPPPPPPGAVYPQKPQNTNVASGGIDGTPMNAIPSQQQVTPLSDQATLRSTSGVAYLTFSYDCLGKAFLVLLVAKLWK